MVSIVVLIIAFGYVLSYAFDPGFFFMIMIISIIFSITYTVTGYYKSDKIAIAAAGARPAGNDTLILRQYHNVVEGITLASGLPKPKLYIMNNPQINAFATGRNPQNSAICVTTGALEKLNKQELEGVLAHEMSHIANYDIRLMTLSAVLIGMIAIASQIFLRSLWYGGMKGSDDNKGGAILMIIGIVLAILAPIFANLAGLAISRKREYTADATGVKFVRSPTGLKNALIKIKEEHTVETTKGRKVSKAIAPLFISDPFKNKIQNAFSTHPPLGKRIAILERM